MIIIPILAASGCGGGRTSARGYGGSYFGVPATAPPWYPPSLDDKVRTTAEFDNVTYYLPSLESWYLYDATAKYHWVSAIGTSSGLSASMTNPFKEVGVMFIPTDNYNSPGQVTFYIDGQQAGTLDLSQSSPYTGYSDDYVSYYEIATGLTETTHTVTMVIATGSVAFDGWRMVYKDQVYNIDCSDANTLEGDTIDEVGKLRDGIEEFAQEYGAYPNTANFSDLISYVNASASIFASLPTNPFTGDTMSASETYSAGDYYYVYESDTEYTLSAYGGSGTLITLTENSAQTNLLSLTLTSPQNHFATSSAYVEFQGTAADSGTDDWGAAYLSICCGLNGSTYFPATGPFYVQIFLNEGVNDLRATLTDPFGNSVSLTRTITMDTTAPDILLIDPFPLVGPVGSQYVNVYQTPTTVKACVGINSTATLNDIAMTVDYLGVFTYDLEVQEGNNTITITAADSFDNTNTATYTIVYTAP